MGKKKKGKQEQHDAEVQAPQAGARQEAEPARRRR